MRARFDQFVPVSLAPVDDARWVEQEEEQHNGGIDKDFLPGLRGRELLLARSIAVRGGGGCGAPASAGLCRPLGRRWLAVILSLHRQLHDGEVDGRGHGALGPPDHECGPVVSRRRSAHVRI